MKKKPSTKLSPEDQIKMVREAEVIAAEEAELRKRMRRRAVDDADASHQGGRGAQGGQADFGNPENFADPDTTY